MVFLICYFSIFFILALCTTSDTNFKKLNSLQIVLFYYSIVLLVLVVGFRTPGIDNDYKNYEWIYNSNVFSIEISFKIIRYILKDILGLSIVSLMLFYAFFSIYLKVKIIKEYSNYIFLSFITFLSDTLLLQECTQIRVGLAVAFFLISLKYVYERKFIKFVFFIMIATFFHYSAIIGIIVYIFNPKKLNKLFCIIILLFGFVFSIFCRFTHFNPVSVLGLIPITYIQRKVISYTSNPIPANPFSIIGFLNTFNPIYFFICSISLLNVSSNPEFSPKSSNCKSNALVPINILFIFSV